MIFHIKNIYVCISWYFVAMLLWIVLSKKIITFLICLSALVFHEAGHIITANLLKEKVSIFYILPFGFCCRLRNQNKISNDKMIKILLAGPIVSLLTGGLFLWTKEFSVANLIIGMLNLLPFGNLDGGRLGKIMIK